jgi:hypothetical protein
MTQPKVSQKQYNGSPGRKPKLGIEDCIKEKSVNASWCPLLEAIIETLLFDYGQLLPRSLEHAIVIEQLPTCPLDFFLFFFFLGRRFFPFRLAGGVESEGK